MNETPKVTGNSTLPQQNNPVGGVTPSGGGNPKLEAINQGVNAIDSVSDKLGITDGQPQVGQQVAGGEPQVDENGNEVPGYKPGDKIAPGMEVGEDGKVKQNSVARLTNNVGRAAGAYFGGTKGLEAADNIEKSRVGQKLVGVVSDTVENSGVAGDAVKKVADELEKVGVDDAIEGGTKALSGLKSGDLSEASEGLKQVNEGRKKLRNRIIIGAITSSFFLIFLGMLLLVVSSSISDENDTSSNQIYENTYNYEWETKDDEDDDNPGGGGGGGTVIFTGHRLTQEEIDQITSNIPGWNVLSQTRRNIILAGLSAVGLPYTYGSHASGPGLSGIPSSGLDCSAFVNWAYWTGLGSNPSFGTTATIFSNSGNWFDARTFDTMTPGDVGVRRSNGEGHTAIYLGNNTWVHASSKKTGIIVSSYSSKNVYMRFYSYKGI